MVISPEVLSPYVLVAGKLVYIGEKENKSAQQSMVYLKINNSHRLN